ncbi:MAG: type II toxin-antitoxin system PemK/MazF family toxin [Elusimicrobia bacterium]|nr:type II toxin-antitoxin system PemK/MazF family toxin [Elusimicrobiota bacterium]
MTTPPKSGDVYLADFEPTRGSEQGRKRPVVVFQNINLAGFTSTRLCVPLTSNLNRRGLPGTCSIRKGEAGLPQESVALAFQMRAMDISRFEKRYGRLSQESLEQVANAILNALGISFD